MLFLKRGEFLKGLNCLIKPEMFGVNFLATSRGFFLALTTLTKLSKSLFVRGPWLEGNEDAQSTESSSEVAVSSHIGQSVEAGEEGTGEGGLEVRKVLRVGDNCATV